MWHALNKAFCMLLLRLTASHSGLSGPSEAIFECQVLDYVSLKITKESRQNLAFNNVSSCLDDGPWVKLIADAQYALPPIYSRRVVWKTIFECCNRLPRFETVREGPSLWCRRLRSSPQAPHAPRPPTSTHVRETHGSRSHVAAL